MAINTLAELNTAGVKFWAKDADIWVTGGMATTLREEYIRPETQRVLEQYQEASKKGIKHLSKLYGERYNQLYREDVRAAMEKAGKK